jgi:multiple sugar transport system permease protein/putative aldouronate transport system permease protein
MSSTSQTGAIEVGGYSGTGIRQRTRKAGITRLLMQMRRRWQLYVLLLLPLAYIITFHYVPMIGAQIAFRDYSVRGGVWGSEWVGFENFQRFFDSYLFGRLIVNTLTLGLYTLVAGFPIPIILALSLNQVRNVFFKKTVQMVTYAPYFISTVVMVGLLLQFFNPRFGIASQISMSLTGQPLNILNDPNWFQSLFVWSGVWQGMGFATVIYLAALTTIDPALHEAATVDGASRLQRIRHIDLPGIMPVTTMLLILNMGNFINIGFEKVLLMQNPINTGVSEIIDTYIYKIGLASTALDFSYATAIGLFKGVIALVLVVTANWAVKRMGQDGLW